MGMFDSLIDADGHDWQTKAFGCGLARWAIGEYVHPGTFQVEVLGDQDGEFVDSFATVVDGVLEAVPALRDPKLPLLDYHGGVIEAGEQ